MPEWIKQRETPGVAVAVVDEGRGFESLQARSPIFRNLIPHYFTGPRYLSNQPKVSLMRSFLGTI